MADGQPEMIPMPGPGPQGPPPELTRQLSPQEERDVLLNFMGNMYGEAKKMDSQIITSSTTLQGGKSEEIKRQIEQVYTQPQQSVPVQVQAAPPVQSTPLEAQPNKVTVSQPLISETVIENSDQLTLNFNVSEKEDLINQVNDLVKKLNFQTKQIKELNKKIDNIIDRVTTTSLPIRKQAKKKSVDK
jgi:hypothetical protein